MYQQLYVFLFHLPRKLREQDKIQHMRWSLGLFVVAQIFLNTATAFIAVMCIGLAKELWDERYGSGFCFFDITGNLIGCCAGVLIINTLNYILNI